MKNAFKMAGAKFLFATLIAAGISYAQYDNSGYVDNAYSQGYNNGPQQGYQNNGYNQGYNNGPQQGYQDNGYNQGYNNGPQQGYQNNGYNQGYNNGPQQGYQNNGYNQGYNNGPQQGYQNNGYNQGYNNGPQQGYQGSVYSQGYNNPPPQGTYNPVAAKDVKVLQTLNFALPIESEEWKIGHGRADMSSYGFEFLWNRIKVAQNGYSSTFGLGFGYNNVSVEDQWDISGFDFNLKAGWGFAPVAGDFILAMHIILGFDVKILEEEGHSRFDVEEEEDYDVYNRSYSYSRSTYAYEASANYIDLLLGGNVVLAYQVTSNFGVTAGVDVTTNMVGLGAFSIEYGYDDDDSWVISYQFTGINITPRAGIFFTF